MSQSVNAFLADYIYEDNVYTFLEHHGVKGMRWGVITKQNKPKAGGVKSKEKSGILQKLSKRQSEIKGEKAAIFQIRADKANVRISELNKEIATLPKGLKASAKKRELKGTKYQQEYDLARAKNIRKSFLTPTQKNLLIGATVAGVVIGAGYLATRGTEDISSAFRRAQSMAQHGSIFKIDKSLADKSFSPEQVLEKVAKTINPNYGTPGGTMNCRRATFAYELRRRGFNVEATTSPFGRGQSETGLVNALIRGDKNRISPASMSSMIVKGKGIRGRPIPDLRKYKAGAATAPFSTMTNIINALSKSPTGSRGEIVFNERQFGHSMAWEIFNGKPHIFDTQKGVHYPVTQEGLQTLFGKWGVPSEVAITRLDDVDLDMEFLSRWARNSRK